MDHFPELPSRYLGANHKSIQHFGPDAYHEKGMAELPDRFCLQSGTCHENTFCFFIRTL
jgi:hypothetical protein